MTVNKQTPAEADVERKAEAPSAPTRRKIVVTLGLDRFSGLYV